MRARFGRDTEEARDAENGWRGGGGAGGERRVRGGGSEAGGEGRAEDGGGGGRGAEGDTEGQRPRQGADNMGRDQGREKDLERIRRWKTCRLLV